MESATPTFEPPAIHRPGHRIPGFVAGSLVASVHRRAGEAALLRDRRLELEVGRSGELRMRMIRGIARRAS